MPQSVELLGLSISQFSNLDPRPTDFKPDFKASDKENHLM